MEILALICARGGSKGIPRKNLLPLGGIPLIAWTIKAAIDSGVAGMVVVSTDDPEIAGAARDHGALTPFTRPPELAGDSVRMMPVILHALEWLAKHRDYHPDYLLLLQPTSPFRNADDIIAAVNIARESGCDAVTSVSPAALHPYYARTIDENGVIHDLIKARDSNPNRQELPEVFSENGAIFLVRVSALMAENTVMPRDSRAYVMPPERAFDIDEPWDLRLARLMLEETDRN